jgi:hypothetical protein
VDAAHSEGLIVFSNLRQCTDIGEITEVKAKAVPFVATNAPGELVDVKSLAEVREAAAAHSQRLKALMG